MDRHLLHVEDQVTYCGKPLAGLYVTTTMAMLTCTSCYSAHRMEQELRHATVDDFEEA